jgi:hypothetical protein
MKLDPGMHIGMHLVFFGKSGVTLWLSKHLVIMFRKEIFRNGNRYLVKPRVSFWRNRFNRPLLLVKPGTLVRLPP